MSNFTNIQFLKEKQYKAPDNLEARIRLHRDFSVQEKDWQQWVFEELYLSENDQVLEIGCGPASLWRENLERLPKGLAATLGDISLGMAAQAERNLTGAGGFRFLTVDAQSIPFEGNTFDIVVANHMLYHVPDVSRAAREIRRVLNPGGKLFAATNGARHMQRLYDLVTEFDPTIRVSMGDIHRNFRLENASEILGEVFENVKIIDFDSRLEITEAQPLVDYVFSMATIQVDKDPAGDIAARLFQFFDEKISADGKIVIPKSTGLVIAC